MKKKSYNQIRATLAVTVASLKASIRNPSSIVFGFLFPLVFIMVFGFIGNGGMNVEVVLQSGSDTDNPVYSALSEIDSISITESESSQEDDDYMTDLEKGNIDAILNISIFTDPVSSPMYDVKVSTSEASADGGGIFLSVLSGITDKILLSQAQIEIPLVAVNHEEVESREYKTIDFILPGQLGFSLLTSGIFATSFVFISLKQTLVVKRFFATPIRKVNIILGEALSRLIFSLVQAGVIILVGKFAFGFTLVNGWITVVSMLILSAIGLIVFMGVGFIVSSIAKSEQAVPPIANLFTLPQFLLAGTFFPIEVFPEWLQPISRALPLTYLNDAMRMIAFEGVSFTEIGTELLALLIWSIIVYILAIRLFKWE